MSMRIFKKTPLSSQSTQPKAKPITDRRRSASVEAVDDEDNLSHQNAGRPQDPNTIIESVYDDEWESLMERSRSKGSASTKGKGAAKPQGPPTNSKSKQQHRRSASVEEVNDEDNLSLRNVYDDESETPASKKKVATSKKPSRKAAAEVVEEEDGLQEDVMKLSLASKFDFIGFNMLTTIQNVFKKLGNPTSMCSSVLKLTSPMLMAVVHMTSPVQLRTVREKEKTQD
jgi:hypothetical protein